MAGGGGIGQGLGNSMMRMGSRLGGNLPSQGPAVPSYVPPSALAQQASPFSGFTGVAGYDTPMPVAPQMPQQLSPLTQQLMQRALPPPPMMGLPAALMQMQGRLNQPMMRGPMPVYQNRALAYRPNMAPAQQALNRVQPSVYKTDLDAARARIAELEAARQPSSSSSSSVGGAGGSGEGGG